MCYNKKIKRGYMSKKKYTVGLQYTVWIDVDANDIEEATDQACNSEYDLKLVPGKNPANVNPTYVKRRLGIHVSKAP